MNGTNGTVWKWISGILFSFILGALIPIGLTLYFNSNNASKTDLAVVSGKLDVVQQQIHDTNVDVGEIKQWIKDHDKGSQ